MRVIGIIRIIGLIEQAAGRSLCIICKCPAVGHDILGDYAGLPKVGMFVRIFVETAGENLIEVTAGDDIVALFVFRLNELTKLLGLGYFALTVVICLKVQINYDELPI